jgi:SPP1 family predicted phage head-tail adaptor
LSLTISAADVRAGRLRNAAALQTNTPTRDGAGGEVASWANTLSPWYCELVQVKGGETFRGRMVHAAANYVAIGRYVSGVTPRMRLILGSRIFDILAADNVENRGRDLRLDLVERML